MHVNDILTHPDLPAFKTRFAALVDRRGPDECWPWLGNTDPGGYGQLVLGGGAHKAHRVARVLANGAIPPSGIARSLSVCHSCDNRLCVNPAHLWVGTDRDNVQDMVRKGRIQRGEKHYAAKLTEDQVKAIRADPRSLRVLGALYGVSPSTIGTVRKPENWPSVSDRSMFTSAELRQANLKRGQDSKQSSLTDAAVYAIRADGRTLREIATSYKVTPGNIREIKLRHTWAHLPPKPGDVPATVAPRHKKPAAIGKLANLRRAVEILLAKREEMDEGWFVPTYAMQQLEESL
jgi:hypothetical protein